MVCGLWFVVLCVLCVSAVKGEGMKIIVEYECGHRFIFRHGVHTTPGGIISVEDGRKSAVLAISFSLKEQEQAGKSVCPMCRGMMPLEVRLRMMAGKAIETITTENTEKNKGL